MAVMEQLRGANECLPGAALPAFPASVSVGLVLEALGGGGSWRLPRGLALGPSLAEEGETGLWCVGGALGPGALLPLGGPSLEEPQSEPEAEASPSPFQKEAPTCRDTVGWRSLVKRSRKEDEANVSLIWISGQLYIRVCSPIPSGTELLYWFAEPKASSASLEKCVPASESDAVVIESVELQKPLAIAETTDVEIEALVQQGDTFSDGNSADLFAGGIMGIPPKAVLLSI